MTASEKIMQEAISFYGKDAQIDKAIEEMSELTKALLKNRHKTKDYEEAIYRDAIAEEIGDVMIMIQQLRMIFDCDGKILDYQDEKLRRLDKRMKAEAAKAAGAV